MIKLTSLKVEVVKRLDGEDGKWDYVDNPTLRGIIEWAINEPLEDLVRRVLIATLKKVGKDRAEADNFWVRVVSSRKLRLGYCFHRNRELAEAILPDMIVGWSNNIPDFMESVAHEALHAIKWDEDEVEKMALKIAGTVPYDESY